MGDEGESVLYGDTITLLNTSQLLYLNYQEESKGEITSGELTLGRNGIGWRLREFHKFNKSERKLIQGLGKGEEPIKAGSPCRLFYREIGIITARINDDKYRNEEFDITLDEHIPLNTPHLQKKTPLDLIFAEFFPSTGDPQNSHKRYYLHLRTTKYSLADKLAMDSHSIFAFEHVHPFDGSLLTWNKPIRLFHVSSGFWLNMKEKRPVLSKEMGEDSLFMFQPLLPQKQNSLFTYNSHARIVHMGETKGYIGCRLTSALIHKEKSRLERQNEEYIKEDELLGQNEEVPQDDLEEETNFQEPKSKSTPHMQERVNLPQSMNIQEGKALLEVVKSVTSKNIQRVKACDKEVDLIYLNKPDDLDMFTIQPIKTNIATELQIINQYKKFIEM